MASTEQRMEQSANARKRKLPDPKRKNPYIKNQLIHRLITSAESLQARRLKFYLTPKKKDMILHAIVFAHAHLQVTGPKLTDDVVKLVQKIYGFGRSTIFKVWKESKNANIQLPLSHHTGRSGRKNRD